MVRRRPVEQPASRLAIWSRRCALFSLAASALAILILRAELLEPEPALATLAGALAFSVAAVVLALAAFAAIWEDGIAGGGSAFVGFLVGAALLAYPAYLGVRAHQLPAISDITTDTLDPPRFEVIARLRPDDGGRHGGRAVIEQQQAAYPEIEPIMAAVAPPAAHRAVLGQIRRNRWLVMADRPPQPPERPEGLIETVARSPLLGLRNDIAIRVRAVADGSRIDIRSASRFGRHDLGANAARVNGLAQQIATALARLPAEPAPEPPAPTQGTMKKK